MTSALPLGTETLADRDTVPLASTTTLGSSADTLPIEIFEHRKFLRVECSAALHSGQKVPKIWKCNHCNKGQHDV